MSEPESGWNPMQALTNHPPFMEVGFMAEPSLFEDCISVKQCSRCKEVKPLDQFKKRTDRAKLGQKFKREVSKFTSCCRKCCSALTMAWARANPERVRIIQRKGRLKSRDWRLKKYYGISIEEYQKRLVDQSHKCAVCGSSKGGKLGVFYVDHCHSSGKVRGLLCNLCNVAIGSMRDNPQFLRAAAEYLEKTK